MYYLGWASGKLTKYLSCGKPVITPEYLYNYKELIENNGLGKTVTSASQIPKALKLINKDYERYTITIGEFYKKNLEYSMVFSTVIKKLEHGLHKS
jgi:hypothetical protein